MNNFEFSEKMKTRTKAFAVQIVKFYKTLPKTDEARVLGRQVLRSGLRSRPITGPSAGRNPKPISFPKWERSLRKRMNLCFGWSSSRKQKSVRLTNCRS